MGEWGLHQQTFIKHIGFSTSEPTLMLAKWAAQDLGLAVQWPSMHGPLGPTSAPQKTIQTLSQFGFASRWADLQALRDLWIQRLWVRDHTFTE